MLLDDKYIKYKDARSQRRKLGCQLLVLLLLLVLVVFFPPYQVMLAVWNARRRTLPYYATPNGRGTDQESSAQDLDDEDEEDDAGGLIAVEEGGLTVGAHARAHTAKGTARSRRQPSQKGGHEFTNTPLVAEGQRGNMRERKRAHKRQVELLRSAQKRRRQKLQKRRGKRAKSEHGKRKRKNERKVRGDRSKKKHRRRARKLRQRRRRRKRPRASSDPAFRAKGGISGGVGSSGHQEPEVAKAHDDAKSPHANPATQDPVPNAGNSLPKPDEWKRDLFWFVSSWGWCTQTCGGGVRSRDVLCTYKPTMTAAQEQDCLSIQGILGPKPLSKEACNTHACAAAA